MTEVFKKYKYSIISILYWLIAGAIPLIVILREFDNGIGLRYALFYSHFFIYPVFFGFLSTYFSLKAIHFLLSIGRQYRSNSSNFRDIIILIMVTSVISLAEFAGTGGFPAVWEVNRNAVNALISQSKIDCRLEFLGSNNNINIKYLNNWSNFYSHFDEPPETPLIKDYQDKTQFAERKSEVEARRKEFTCILSAAIEKRKNWSLTRYFYFVSFFIQTMALLALYYAVTIFSIPKFRTFLEAQLRDGNLKFRKYLILLSASVIVGSFWLLMRIGFELDKPKIYSSTTIGSLAIAIAFIVAIIFITYNLLLVVDEKRQGVINIISAFLLAGATLIIKATGENVFGKAKLADYCIATILIIAMLIPWYLSYQDTLNTKVEQDVRN